MLKSLHPDQYNAANSNTEYAENFLASFPLPTLLAKQPKSANVLVTDRAFFKYWKDSESHEYHKDPKLHIEPKTKICACKPSNKTSYKDHRDPTFENDMSTTYQEYFRTLPLEEKPQIKVLTSSVPFDAVEFQKIPTSCYAKDYTPHSNVKIPESFQTRFTSPIYKDDRFRWVESETKRKFQNPKIYPPNREIKSKKEDNYPSSTNIMGQTKNVTPIKPETVYGYYYTTPKVIEKAEQVERQKLILGDERISYRQWQKTLVHEDFSFVRGDRAVPSKQYPLQLGHPNCGADYNSTTAKDDYRGYGKQSRSEIDPLWTHHSSKVVIGRPEYVGLPIQTSHALHRAWNKGDRCERRIYPKWELVDKNKVMDSDTEFCSAYGNAVYDVKLTPEFKDVTHIKSENNKGICDDGTTYKDEFKGHKAYLPYNCTWLKQQDRRIKIPYFSKAVYADC